MTAREQELELEVARLTAELETLRGEEPTLAASRFLSMAAATVDRAVADARREADEIAEEISAAAEARRDEATRLAVEAQADADRLRAEAEDAQSVLDEAEAEAEAIRARAAEEAVRLAEAQRDRAAGEIAALTEVREALEEERGSLESYHEELGRRVQDLAESMVAFMSTEPPLAPGGALASLPLLGIEAGAGEAVEDGVEEWLEGPVDDGVEEWLVESADALTEEHAEERLVESAVALAEVPVEEPVEEHAEERLVESAVALAEVPVEEPVEEWVVADRRDDVGFGAALSEAIGEEAETIDAGSTRGWFADAPIVDRSAMAEGDGDDEGLFGPATDQEAERQPGSLFGDHGARLLEQTNPDELADALDDDSSAADEAFRAFLTGDDEPDPSREWLLRPETS